MRVTIFVLSVAGVAGKFGDAVCRAGDLSKGECRVDGTGCAGETVEFSPYTLKVSAWNRTTKSSTEHGIISSHVIAGAQDTWQMYLHGPHIHAREREVGDLSMPPVYVFATWNNRVYRWDNFSQPSSSGPMRATQRMVGHTLAPSTGFPIDDPQSTRVKGLLVAEGQPFWFSDEPGAPRASLYKGGIHFLPSTDSYAENCTQVFPTNPFHKKFGQVTNTVDCHKGTGVCFFTVWKFYDDDMPWSNISNLVANDCLYYCIMAPGGLNSKPSCRKTGVVVDEHGERICHKNGVGAVHGMTVAKTDPLDANKFDILLVYTGKGAKTITDGESSMKKVTLQAFPGGALDIKVLHSAPFATELFVDYARAKGGDVGGDHAWVDDSGKFVWISAFRTHCVGLHMVEYDTGKLIHSVTGIDSFVPNNYAYPAGIHGVGTIGKKGSYLAVATSACRSTKACFPIPWMKPIPKALWAKAVFFVIDLSSLQTGKSTILV